MSARDYLDALLHQGQEDHAALVQRQRPGRCDNPYHGHVMPPFRFRVAGYWMCPLDKVASPRVAGEMIAVGELTSLERERIDTRSGRGVKRASKKKGLRRRRR